MNPPAAPDETAAESPEIIDVTHLASFTEGDTAFEGELAELFVNTALGYLKRMQQALDAGRPWSAEAHALKGAAANLGARQIAELARQAEFSPPSENDLNRLRSAIDDVQAFFADRAR